MESSYLPALQLSALTNENGDWDRDLLQVALSSFSQFFVKDDESRQHLIAVQQDLAAELDAEGYSVFSCMTCSEDDGPDGEELLKRLLQLGMDPDLAVGMDDPHMRQSHRFASWGASALLELLLVCRPNLSAKDDDDLTPEQKALHWVKNEEEPMEERRRYLQVVGLFRKLAKDGFPSIAELACDQKWWGVQNLARRYVVSPQEAAKKFLRKTAIEWAKFHGQEELAEELVFLLGIDANDSSSDKESQELREVLLASVTQLKEEICELTEKVEALKQELLQCDAANERKLQEKMAEMEQKWKGHLESLPNQPKTSQSRLAHAKRAKLDS